MREICPHCDQPMYLSKDTTQDSPHLLWICSTAPNANFENGTLLITPNWGLVLKDFKIQPDWYAPADDSKK